MADLKALEIQLATLQQQVTAERARVKSETIEALRMMLDSGTLEPDDLIALLPVPAALPPRNRKPMHPPKYRDPVSGNTWSGKGKIPQWINGKNRDDFLIPPGA